MTDGRCDPAVRALENGRYRRVPARRAATPPSAVRLHGHCAADQLHRTTITAECTCVLALFLQLDRPASCSVTRYRRPTATPNVARRCASTPPRCPNRERGGDDHRLSRPAPTAAALRVTVTGTLPDGDWLRDVSGPLCGLAASATSASTTQDRSSVPISVFADHPLVNPPAGDAARWFFSNRWHDVTYYAVSPGHLPSGSRDCVASANCLTLNVQAGATLRPPRASGPRRAQRARHGGLEPDARRLPGSCRKHRRRSPVPAKPRQPGFQ